jgi:hypothetical protein
MGRSGTSAVTRALVTSGFYAGSEAELMEATPANPAGYWEHLGAFRVNEEILERAGGTWFMPPTTAAQLAIRPWAEARLRKLVGQLFGDANGAPVVIKDPRIGVLLDLWGPIIDEALHPVLVIRNPVEIALSLATRDGTPTAFSLASWELHMMRVLEFLQARTATIVPHAELVRSPDTARLFVADVAARLSPECASRIDPADAPAAVEPELHRERAAATDPAEYMTGRQASLWQFLAGMSRGNQLLDVPSELRRTSRAAEDLVRCETARVQQVRLEKDLRAHVVRQESMLAAERERTAEAVRERDIERSRADAAQHWLNEIQGSASWRLTAPLRTILRQFRRLRDTWRSP